MPKTMPKRGFRRFLAIGVALVSVSMFSTATATAAPTPAPGVFSSCAAIRTALPFASNGNYILFTEQAMVGVYCHDMAGTPKEYLNLVNTGGSANFSQYTAGGASPGTNVRTSFTKIRINPTTLTVDLNDLTFATSTGQLQHGPSAVISMSYASAMSCDGRSTGAANIDLQGTAFTIADTFSVGGFNAVGNATVNPTNQVANLSGGGYCGWINPTPGLYGPFNPAGSAYLLELACAPFDATGLLQAKVCLRFT